MLTQRYPDVHLIGGETTGTPVIELWSNGDEFGILFDMRLTDDQMAAGIIDAIAYLDLQRAFEVA